MVTEVTCVDYIEDGILWKTIATQVQGVSLPKCHLKITSVQKFFFPFIFIILLTEENGKVKRRNTKGHFYRMDYLPFYT